MTYDVTVETARSRPLAVVRERRKWTQLGGQLLSLLDRVYVAVRSGRVIQSGHNVFLYRERTRDEVTVEVGVEVTSPFKDDAGVMYSETPAGMVATTVHLGEYSGLGRAHEAVIRWCAEHNQERADVWWEVYGDWHEDPAQMRTQVFYLLQSGGT